MTPRGRQILACLALIAGTLIAFGEVGNHRFIHFDDLYYLSENPRVQEGLTGGGIIWAFTTTRAGYWMPLTWLSFMLDSSLFGLHPGGFHLTNLLFHLANTLLLFLWLQRATRTPGPAFLAAALFAWHPLHVESVAWVAERKDVLSAFFWLAAMWAYLKYGERPARGRYGLLLLCFTLGLMCKPMVVTLPLVLLFLDYWPLGRWTPDKGSAKGLILEKLPLLVLAAVFGAITWYAQKEVGAVALLEEIPVSSRAACALLAYVWYLWKMCWPTGLAVLYPHPLDTIPLWQALGAGLVLAAVSIPVLWRGRSYPYLPVGWLWYLVTLMPVIGLLQAGSQAWADRYTYIPLIGLFIMAAWGARDLTAGLPRAGILRPLGAGIMLAVLLILTFFQVRLWRDSVTLFTHTLRVTDDNPVIHHNLGVALAARGREEEAARHFLEALRLDPHNPRGQNRLGEEWFDQGKIAAAEAKFRRAIKLKPDFAAAFNNLGRVYAHRGDLDRAMAHFHKAIDLAPNFAAAYKNLGMAHASRGETQKAAAMLRKALEVNPDDREAQQILQMLKTPATN
jgi:cytochrome c-type biogenesis protein CcmH/NrfG